MIPSKVLNKILKKSQYTPIVVQFYAKWCGPCRTLKPVLQGLSRKANSKWKLETLDVETNREAATQYRIVSIPTVHLFHKGESIATFTGVKSAATIQNWLATNLPKRRKKSKYAAAERALQQGNIPLATIQLLGRLHEEQPEDSTVKILLALQYLGSNNPQAMQLLNQLDPKGDIKTIAQQLQNLIEMEVEEQDKHTPTSSPYTPNVADANEKIDLANFDANLLAQLVHYGINRVRNNQGVNILENNSVLAAAATDQNAYQLKNDVLSHTQNNTAKRTVKERVNSFGGGFRTMGENVQYQGMQITRWGNQQEIVTDTYVNTAKKLVENWVKSPGHYKNLISPNFKFSGMAIGWNPENHAIFATQVFGG